MNLCAINKVLGIQNYCFRLGVIKVSRCVRNLFDSSRVLKIIN